jgi:hypothetical protein
MPNIFTNSGLDFADSKRLSVIARGHVARGIPQFALGSDLQTVLAARAWRFLHAKRPIPPHVAQLWKGLDVACTERACADLRRNPTTSAKSRYHATAFAGSYLAGQCAIAYAAWRLGLGNGDIAAQFGLTKGMVKEYLASLLRTAERLGLPTREYGALKGRRRVEPKPRKTAKEISAARSAGAYRFWARRKAQKQNAQQPAPGVVVVQIPA